VKNAEHTTLFQKVPPEGVLVGVCCAMSGTVYGMILLTRGTRKYTTWT
jgi:hypothetical protein